MKDKMLVRWTVDSNTVNVSWGRYAKYGSSWSFNHYKNITPSSQKRLVKLIARYGSKWVYNIWKNGYNEIELWYKENQTSTNSWLIGREDSRKRII